MKLGAIIADYRERMQISQREFARRCGLSNSYISFLEKENNPKTGRPMAPTLVQYKKIASGMNLTVHQLFEILDDDSPVDMSSDSLKLTDNPDVPENDILRRLVSDLNQLTPDQASQARSVLRAVFKNTNPDLFREDDDQ